MIKEIFRPVKGNEQYYVSNYGRVLSTCTGKILCMHKTKKGYLRVTLSVNGKKKHFKVHRLVAQAFIPNPNNLDTVDHINNIKTDNRVENLQWLSNLDNVYKYINEQKEHCPPTLSHIEYD